MTGTKELYNEIQIVEEEKEENVEIEEKEEDFLTPIRRTSD